MNYLLNDDQEAFIDTARKFLSEHAASSFLHQIADRRGDWRQELRLLWQAFAELGFAGLLIGEQFGGIGLSLFDTALINEVVGAAVAPMPFIAHHLCCLAIQRAGSPAQKAKWLPRLASGELIGSVALAGGGGRYLPQDWRIDQSTSSPQQLSNLEVSGSDLPSLIVVGLTGGGLGILSPEQTHGNRTDRPCVDPGSFLADVIIDAAVIDPLPGGGEYGQAIVDAGWVLQAAQACGGIRACVEQAADYAKVREQFGVPIGQFQAVKHQLADLALEADPNRPLVWHAAQAADAGQTLASRYAALAKSHLSDAYLRVARKTIELHGGFGYTWEADMHLYLKRAIFLHAHLGNSLYLRQRLGSALTARTA